MTTVPVAVLRRPCYCLGLAGPAWVAGFVLLCIVHLHEPGSVEIHRYKHTFDDDELYLMSLQVTEDQAGTIGHIDGTVYPSEHDQHVSQSQMHQDFTMRPNAVKKNIASDRFQQLTERHRNRRQKIRDVCLKQRHELSSNQTTTRKPRPELSTNHISSLTLKTLRHIYVSDKHHFMYCYIPEVASSNWKRVMMLLKTSQLNIGDISSRESHSQSGLKTLKNYDPEEQQWRLKSYKKFLFVRDPVSRIISAYRTGQHIVKQYRRNATAQQIQTGENVTWSKWISYLTNRQEEATFGDHWVQMSKLCSPCDVDYDYIGKLETFSEDADFILKSLNLTDVTAKFPGPENSDPTNSSLSETKAHFGRVSKRKRQSLWEAYKLDFQMFGYERPDFLI